MRTVDIVKWESAAFRQAGREWGINSIPYVRVYGKDGGLVYKGSSFDQIRAAVAKAAR